MCGLVMRARRPKPQIYRMIWVLGLLLALSQKSTASGSRSNSTLLTNYTTADGLPPPIVRSFLETRSGVYWVGTYYGGCQFNPKVRPSSGAKPNNQRITENGRGTTDNPMFVLYSQTGTLNALLNGRGRGWQRACEHAESGERGSRSTPSHSTSETSTTSCKSTPGRKQWRRRCATA